MTKKKADSQAVKAAELQLKALLQEQVDHIAGAPEQYTKPISYVYTPEGAYEVRLTAFGTFTIKVNKIKNISQAKIEPGVLLHHGKIPFRMLAEALDFFRQAYAAPRKSEALYMIMFNPETKEYVSHVPRQWDGPGHAKEADATERPAGHILVAHIHSHPNFGGKFSGIDNGDDRRCSDAAIFGVLGHINRDQPEMQWRISVGGNYVDVDVWDIFTSPLAVGAAQVHAAPAEWLERIEDPPQPERKVEVFQPSPYHNQRYLGYEPYDPSIWGY